MEDNRKFATFFADAPKGKKIGAVLSWIATVVLLVALFVPGYQIEFQTRNDPDREEYHTVDKGDKRDEDAISFWEYDWNEDWESTTRYFKNNELEKLKPFVENKETSAFGYLSNSALMRVSFADNEVTVSDSSLLGIGLLIVFCALIIVAAVAGVYTISWAVLVANLIGVVELEAVYFFIFAKRFPSVSNLLEIYRRTTKPSPVLIVLLALVVLLSVAAVIVSYAVHEGEEVFVDNWSDSDPGRDSETSLVDDGNTTTVPATDNAMTVVASLVQLNTNRSFAIYNNTEVVIGKGSQANIIVSNPIISRAHAKISCRNGVCTIQDLGSKNGTFVGDGKIMGNDTVTLANGMYITLGNEIFQFKV